MPVTLINTFKVPAEQEQEFLTRWSETTAIYARTSGFVETHMLNALLPAEKRLTLAFRSK